MTRFLGRLADPRTLPIVVTIVLFVALFGFGSVMYTGFFSMQVLTGLLVDNAFLLIVAIGMTFVIVSGGIDLSVGSVMALSSAIIAVCLPYGTGAAFAAAIAIGLAVGLFNGGLVARLGIDPL
ncbi:ABC transporter permease subunit, partial [Ralstonia sp. VS2407]